MNEEVGLEFKSKNINQCYCSIDELLLYEYYLNFTFILFSYSQKSKQSTYYILMNRKDKTRDPSLPLSACSLLFTTNVSAGTGQLGTELQYLLSN